MSFDSPVLSWARGDVRARWFALVVLGLLLGVTAGLAVATFDGSRRTGSALHRLEDRVNAPDAIAFPSQTGVTDPDWAGLAARPEVERIARWTLAFGIVDGEDSLVFASTDGVFLGEVDAPIVVRGRMFDPTAPNEVVVTEDGVALGYDLGRHISFEPHTSFEPGAPLGPKVDLEVVGVVRTSLMYLFTGGAFATPAFLETYGEGTLTAENATVSLRDGGDMDALRRDVNTIIGDGVPVLDLESAQRRVTASTDVERAILLVLSVVVVLVGIALVGQAMVRSAAGIGSDAEVLRALGMTRGELVRAALLPHLLVAVLAAAGTVVTAVVASRWFPVGLAAQVDPDRGVQVDGALIVLACALVTAFTVALAVLAAWRAASDRDRAPRRRPSWSSKLGVARPVPWGLGLRMAFDDGREGARSTSRSAFVGAIAAVVGVVALLALEHGLDHALDDPTVAGAAWDVSVIAAGEDLTADGVSPDLLATVAAQPGVAGTVTMGRTVAPVGDIGVPFFARLDPGSGSPIRFTLLRGREPRADDEVVLGPATADDLGAHVGDRVVVGDRESLVVGTALFPPDVHSQFDEGAWVTRDRWFAVQRALHGDELGDSVGIAVRFDRTAPVAEHVEHLVEALDGRPVQVAPVELPLEFLNLGNIRRLPNLLAVFLTLLGMAAVGHALFSSVRHRRHDLAVLRALGLTRWGARATLAAHGTVLALVGLVVGVPAGVLVGRAAWRAITDRVPLSFEAPTALAATVLVVPVVVLVANALAVWPGRRAARVDPAVVLRTE
jgi:ABC-type lipoprotein release transport system permease subunit